MCQHGAQQEKQQSDSRVAEEKSGRIYTHTKSPPPRGLFVPVSGTAGRAVAADGPQELALSLDAATGSKVCSV